MSNNLDIQILSTPLSIDKSYDHVLDASCGGICLFVGTVRNFNKGENITHLDFETYKEMAIKELEKIAIEAINKYGLTKISIHHREGQVGIKEKAVIIACSSVHRDPAFEACSFAIAKLKETVPIWKKEHLENGSYWVNARP